MKKLIIAFVAMWATCTVAAQKNNTITKFQDQKIYGLIATGAFDIRISQGDESYVSVEVREDIAPKISIDLTEEGYVRINYGSEVGKFFKGSNRPFVTIVVDELRYLNLSGVCTTIGKGEYSATERCLLNVGGSATLDFINVKAPTVAMDISGSAIINDITVQTPNLRIDAGTTAKATVKGAAEKSEVNSSGTAVVDILNLVTPEIRAVVGGMSLVKANVSGSADVTRSGTAAFKYTGQGKITGDAKPL